MALTEEQILQQINVLTTRTSENTQMTYKTNGTLNKALNPDVFSGNNTKIVNAINLLASMADIATETSNAVSEKLNNILLDIDVTDNAAVWENVKNLMEKNTIIEGLESILQGEHADKILGLNAADAGKVLSIDVDDNGNVVLKAIDAIAGGGGEPVDVSVESLQYANDKAPEVTNVKEALDHVIDKIAEGDFGDGEWGGGTIVGEITWDMIDDRPEFIADNLELTDSQLILKDGTSILSTVELIDDEDISDIINNL
jgi:hypothetical protein